jgi:hypothetical protein
MAENENNLKTREEWQKDYHQTCDELTAARKKISILRTRLQQAEDRAVGLSRRKQTIERRLVELRYMTPEE